MRGQRLSWLTNIGLILIFLLMSAEAELLFYGLLTNLSFTWREVVCTLKWANDWRNGG